MSLSSIMSSGNDPSPPTKHQPLPPINSEPTRIKLPSVATPYNKQEPLTSPTPLEHIPADANAVNRRYESIPPVALPPPQRTAPREMTIADEAEVEAELAHIETNEMGEVDGPGFEADRDEFLHRGRKRALEADGIEAQKRKVGSRP